MWTWTRSAAPSAGAEGGAGAFVSFSIGSAIIYNPPLGRESTMPKKAAGAPRKPRASKKRAAPGSKGLAPAECKDASLPELTAKIEGHGGAVLACYKEPLGGQATIVAILPIDKVKPTPFQRDLSETNAKRLSETIEKIGRLLAPMIGVNMRDESWTTSGSHQ